MCRGDICFEWAYRTSQLYAAEHPYNLSVTFTQFCTHQPQNFVYTLTHTVLHTCTCTSIITCTCISHFCKVGKYRATCCRPIYVNKLYSAEHPYNLSIDAVLQISIQIELCTLIWQIIISYTSASSHSNNRQIHMYANIQMRVSFHKARKYYTSLGCGTGTINMSGR